MKNQLVLEPCVVGCRIEAGSHFGTVRYIGALPNYPGVWCGVEWDDPTRGKHNGQVNNVQYFTTKRPTSGSFVRCEKLTFGNPLSEAIITKYGKPENEILKKIHQQQLDSLQKTIKAPFIEFVGFDKVRSKQSQFESLKVVSVRNQHVNSIDQLHGTFPNIRQLDLSRNLLISWQDVVKVCEQLPQLYWLNLSENLLKLESFTTTFPNITVLICGHMKLNWDDVKSISKLFPNINELRVNNNEIITLNTEELNNFNNLEILDLEGNPLGSWDEILKLKSIRSLFSLSIPNIGLKTIDFNNENVTCFSNLKKLCLSNNLINDWTSVAELNKLPQLEELRFTHNPILETDDATTTMGIVIAKIRTLKVHNGRQLFHRDEFRKYCEYDYLKKYGLEWLRVKHSPHEREIFLKEHNRYLELIKMYGELELGELKTTDLSKLKDTLITVCLHFESLVVKKRVVPSMSVQKLKMLVQKLFKLPTSPNLVCHPDDDHIEIPLDDDLKELSYFSVKDNDNIYIRT